MEGPASFPPARPLSVVCQPSAALLSGCRNTQSSGCRIVCVWGGVGAKSVSISMVWLLRTCETELGENCKHGRGSAEWRPDIQVQQPLIGERNLQEGSTPPGTPVSYFLLNLYQQPEEQREQCMDTFCSRYCAEHVTYTV